MTDAPKYLAVPSGLTRTDEGLVVLSGAYYSADLVERAVRLALERAAEAAQESLGTFRVGSNTSDSQIDVTTVNRIVANALQTQVDRTVYTIRALDPAAIIHEAVGAK